MENQFDEKKIEKSFDLKLMKRLLTYTKPYLALLIVCFVLIVILAAIDLVKPLILKTALNSFISLGDKAGLTKIILFYFTIVFIGFFVNYIHIYLLNWAGFKIIYNMRQELFSHLQKLSLSFFDKTPVGRLVTRLTNDMENLSEMYTEVLIPLFKDILLLVGTIVIMLRLNAKVAMVCFISFPLIVLSAALFQKQSRAANRLLKVKLAKINATLSENISGMKIIQMFHREAYKFKEFDAINEDHRNSNYKVLKIFAIFRPSMDLIYNFGLSLLIWVAGERVIQGQLDFGTLYAFVSYIDQFFKPINDLTEKFDMMQSAMASSERVFMLLDTPIDIVNTDTPVVLPKLSGKIEFKHVWFAYEGENWVLKDVSFTINPGETVAFVGATGAGKSSIISLITRLYDIQKGEILLDGISIKDLDKYALRQQVAIVLQDVFLFTGDIKGNISLNDTNISYEKMVEASQYVNADSFIQKLPGKYDEKVMERGSTLSSGQRQLLAFARALAFDPNILILDEATSSIDTETEALIQDAIYKITQNRTTIVVAHRLSTIQHANNIVVLHKGCIKEMGTHQELLLKQGMYYDLYMLQYKET